MNAASAIPQWAIEKLRQIHFDQLMPLIEGGVIKADCQRMALWLVSSALLLIASLLMFKHLSFLLAITFATLAWFAAYPLVSFALFYSYIKCIEPDFLQEYNQSVSYVETIEGQGGFLWHFTDFLYQHPHVLHAGVDRTIQQVLVTSKRGKVRDYTHYSDVIGQLQDAFG